VDSGNIFVTRCLLQAYGASQTSVVYPATGSRPRQGDEHPAYTVLVDYGPIYLYHYHTTPTKYAYDSSIKVQKTFYCLFREEINCLQCSDAVGWAAGRASCL